MTTDEAKKAILCQLISGEIGTYMMTYGPKTAVISMSNLLALIPGLTRYRARLAVKELIAEGLIEYTSLGCPAVVSCGEVTELIYDAAPPINGYALTKEGFHTPEFKMMYGDWEKSLWKFAEAEECADEVFEVVE